MRIDKGQLIAGIDAAEARALMRQTYGGYLISADVVVEKLGLSRRHAHAVLRRLCADGFLERKGAFFSATTKGNALVRACAAAPLKQGTALRLLERLLERVEAANQNLDFVYSAETVEVFGSVLTNKERPNDVDVSICLKPRFLALREGPFSRPQPFALWRTETNRRSEGPDLPAGRG